MHMGDSMMCRETPLMHLRYTHATVVMSLACLMDLDGYGLHTSNLDSLEAYGWANYRIAPLGGSIEMIHYRSGRGDPDVLVKVLLNGCESCIAMRIVGLTLMPRKDDENEDAISGGDPRHDSLLTSHASSRMGAAQGDAADQADAVVCLMQLSCLSG